jgi:hypothetical protein
MTKEVKLPLVFCRLLKRLQNNEKISIGKFSSNINKKLLQDFSNENVIRISQQGRTKYIYCSNIEYLNNYLKEFGITNLVEYIEFLEKEDTTRAEAVEIASNSKRKKERIFNGFFVKSYLLIYGEINEQKILLKPQQGTWLYIENYKTFKIDRSITVIGVENTETFTLIENYKHLFKDVKPLFLLRFNNNSYIEWLQSIENEYLHFGDFDLSALAIYITEFRNKLPVERCNFFIPESIVDLIKNSKNKKDFLTQLNDKRVKGIDFNNYKEVSKLAELIYKEKKTIEQEVLMTKHNTQYKKLDVKC